MGDSAATQEVRRQLVEATTTFCDEYLDEDYKQLCEDLIAKLSRKRTVPFMSGQVKTWAATIVYALGQINFLFDKSFEPYVTPAELCAFFGVGMSNASRKATELRRSLGLREFDPEFSTAQVQGSNPMKDMVMIDGLIVPISMLPPEIRDRLK